jgi:hypothetical protein
MTPYDALAALAERELALVGAGAIDELPALHAERRTLLASLPAKPPAEAKPALERAWALQQRVTEALEERIRQAGEELRRVSRGRTAMHGYAPQTDRLKLVDRAG